jgi:hypothetical protein
LRKKTCVVCVHKGRWLYLRALSFAWCSIDTPVEKKGGAQKHIRATIWDRPFQMEEGGGDTAICSYGE